METKGNIKSAGVTVSATTGPPDDSEVGFRGTPLNTQNAAYTFVLSDAGQTIFHDEVTAVLDDLIQFGVKSIGTSPLGREMIKHQNKVAELKSARCATRTINVAGDARASVSHLFDVLKKSLARYLNGEKTAKKTAKVFTATCGRCWAPS